MHSVYCLRGVLYKEYSAYLLEKGTKRVSIWLKIKTKENVVCNTSTTDMAKNTPPCFLAENDAYLDTKQTVHTPPTAPKTIESI